MRTLLIAIIMFTSLLGNARCQTARPTTAADLAKYAGAARSASLALFHSAIVIFRFMRRAPRRGPPTGESSIRLFFGSPTRLPCTR